jgi:hypothetical protein
MNATRIRSRNWLFSKAKLAVLCCRGSKPRGIPHPGKRERERQEYLSRNRTISGKSIFINNNYFISVLFSLGFNWLVFVVDIDPEF